MSIHATQEVAITRDWIMPEERFNGTQAVLGHVGSVLICELGHYRHLAKLVKAA